MLHSAKGVIASAKTAGAPPSGITGSYVTTLSSTTNISSGGGDYTFTGASIGGSPSGTRRIVLGITGRDTANYPTSVTIGGVSAVRDGGVGTTHVTSIWSAVVPTGTTADIVITYAGSQSYCSTSIWWLSGGSAVASASQIGNNVNPSMTLDTQAGDFCVAALSYRASLANNNVAWTGATERFDGVGDSAVRQHSSADTVATGATTTISALISNYSNESAMAGVAYR
jgi:hypothetical protein